jgi:inactivated superfamily I helicase
MNEGKFPAGKSQNSFIPYDVKRELGLPFKRKRCDLYVSFLSFANGLKNIYLLYNTESEGLDAGEKSFNSVGSRKAKKSYTFA